MSDKKKKAKGKQKKKPAEQAPLQPTFKGHQMLVSGVDFFNETLYTGSWDKTCRSWDLKARGLGPSPSALPHVRGLWGLQGEEEKFLFEGHAGGVTAIKISQAMLYSASLDKTVRVWEVKSGACREILRFPTPVVALEVDLNRIYVACEELVYVVNIKTKEVERELRGHDGIVVAVRVNEPLVFTGSWDRTLRAWDPETGECTRVMTGHTDYVTAIALQSHTMYSAALDKTLRVWDVEASACVQCLALPDSAQCLACEGTYLIAGLQDATLVMWDSRTFEQLHVFSGHTDAVRAICLVDGRFFTGSKDKTAKRWDVKDSTTRKPEDEAAQQKEAAAAVAEGDKKAPPKSRGKAKPQAK
eukprot:m51a1_g11106 putative (myosin heavy-chain) kinase (358) ;mRNA; f:65234-66581